MSKGISTALQTALEEFGSIPFVDFCRIALYDPIDGYYSQTRHRVGADRQSDFVTNLAVKSVFAPLVLHAVRTLLEGREMGGYRFLEIAAEPDQSLLSEVDHPFLRADVVRLGDPIPVLDGPTVLFANEWLDAQPFVRLVFREGQWQESFVRKSDTGELEEVFSPPDSADACSLLENLPAEAPEGYRLDLSVEADSVLKSYLDQDWEGLFLTFDYGSSWEALVNSLPGGTGRAYHSHQQSSDLLAQPGQQDLTANVCWDRIASVLKSYSFAVGGPHRQEAFFLEKSSAGIRAMVEGGDSAEARGKRSKLMQLLNPAHFGAAFQAMWGIR